MYVLALIAVDDGSGTMEVTCRMPLPLRVVAPLSKAGVDACYVPPGAQGPRVDHTRYPLEVGDVVYVVGRVFQTRRRRWGVEAVSLEVADVNREARHVTQALRLASTTYVDHTQLPGDLRAACALQDGAGVPAAGTCAALSRREDGELAVALRSERAAPGPAALRRVPPAPRHALPLPRSPCAPAADARHGSPSGRPDRPAATTSSLVHALWSYMAKRARATTGAPSFCGERVFTMDMLQKRFSSLSEAVVRDKHRRAARAPDLTPAALSSYQARLLDKAVRTLERAGLVIRAGVGVQVAHPRLVARHLAAMLRVVPVPAGAAAVPHGAPLDPAAVHARLVRADERMARLPSRTVDHALRLLADARCLDWDGQKYHCLAIDTRASPR